MILSASLTLHYKPFKLFNTPSRKRRGKKPLKDYYSFRTGFAPEVHHLLMCAEWFCIHSGGIVIQRVRKSLGGKTQLDCREGACNQILLLCNRVTGLVISWAHGEPSLRADFSLGHPGKHDLVQKEHTTPFPAGLIIMRRTMYNFTVHKKYLDSTFYLTNLIAHDDFKKRKKKINQMSELYSNCLNTPLKV